MVSDCRGTVVQNLCDRGANQRLNFTLISGDFLLVRCHVFVMVGIVAMGFFQNCLPLCLVNPSLHVVVHERCFVLGRWSYRCCSQLD